MTANVERLNKILNDEKLFNEMISVEKAEDAQKWFSEHDVELTIDEVNALAGFLNKLSSGEISEEQLKKASSGELEEDELALIAGGSGTDIAAGIIAGVMGGGTIAGAAWVICAAFAIPW